MVAAAIHVVFPSQHARLPAVSQHNNNKAITQAFWTPRTAPIVAGMLLLSCPHTFTGLAADVDMQVVVTYYVTVEVSGQSFPWGTEV